MAQNLTMGRWTMASRRLSSVVGRVEPCRAPAPRRRPRECETVGSAGARSGGCPDGGRKSADKSGIDHAQTLVVRLPTTRQQGDVWRALHRQCSEVGQRQQCTSLVDPAFAALPPQNRGDLEVGQLRCGKSLAAQPCTRVGAIWPVVGQGDSQHAGVNDEHDPPVVP